MVKTIFHYAAIKGMCTVVPSNSILLDDESCYYEEVSKLNRLKQAVGLERRVVVDDKTTPADLMECAALNLIEGMKIDVQNIDALICVLDNPDYKCPPTACVLHGKLKMPYSCMAFDITHGCAGYVYGLNVAFSMIESGYKKILMLVGDTKSRTINIKDRISAPIFGDGAAATLIERTETESLSYFSLGTVGEKYEDIIIPAGGARLPCSEETQRETIDEFGNTRSLNNFRMNGRNVFDFTMNVVPQNIEDVLAYASKNIEDIDYFILHQANKSIIQNIASRVGLEDKTIVPIETLAKYGNLAVASVPSVLNDVLSDQVQNKKMTVLLSGFGVGLAYGSVILTLDHIYAPHILTYKG